MNIARRFFSTIMLSTLVFGASSTLAAHHEGGHDAQPTLVEVAAGNSDFSTLVAAVQAAGLVDVLSGEGPFTVFAPTNAAFAKLPAGTVENLLKPENRQQLTDILTYHVVSGAVYASDVVALTSAATVEGSNIAIGASSDGVTINNAKVLATDIEASNGLIHVIDTVLLPTS